MFQLSTPVVARPPSAAQTAPTVWMVAAVRPSLDIVGSSHEYGPPDFVFRYDRRLDRLVRTGPALVPGRHVSREVAVGFVVLFGCSGLDE
jgi:hypothetical protein